jgi:hypothetical protein
VDSASVLADAARLETHVGEQFELIFGNYLELISGGKSDDSSGFRKSNKDLA